MRLKRIRPHERKLRIRLSGKAKQRDRPDILSLTAWSSEHRCRSPDQYGTASRRIDQFCHVIAMLMHEGKIYGASFCFPLHGYAPLSEIFANQDHLNSTADGCFP